MKKILITGGAGFVGRHFTKYWLEQGAHVDCVDPIAEFTGGKDPNEGWPLFDPREYKNFHFHKKDCRVFFRENPTEYYDYALPLGLSSLRLPELLPLLAISLILIQLFRLRIYRQ